MYAFVSRHACLSYGSAHDLCHRKSSRLVPVHAYYYTCPGTNQRCAYRVPADPFRASVGTMPGNAVTLDDAI